MHTTRIVFRKATTADLEEAWTLLDTARNLMLTNGRKQWTKDYPSRELIEDDIIGGDAYILTVDGEVAAYAKLAVNGEPEYAHLEGSWLSEQDYVVIHRLAVSPITEGTDCPSASSTRPKNGQPRKAFIASRLTPTMTTLRC